jgi:hypothetical protein
MGWERRHWGIMFLVTGIGQVALETRDGRMMTWSIGVMRRMGGTGSNGCL